VIILGQETDSEDACCSVIILSCLLSKTAKIRMHKTIILPSVLSSSSFSGHEARPINDLLQPRLCIRLVVSFNGRPSLLSIGR
jgi:hypothetical protein